MIEITGADPNMPIKRQKVDGEALAPEVVEATDAPEVEAPGAYEAPVIEKMSDDAAFAALVDPQP